ncbi:MAG: hypothetical protein HS129_00540 [Leptospiraceae bacterium]|nr:hypothetical protein [Leptospiraceae bacterium]
MNLIVDHIEKNPFSRSGEKLVKVKAIIWHYTAFPKATAKIFVDYFNNLKTNNHINQDMLLHTMRLTKRNYRDHTNGRGRFTM